MRGAISEFLREVSVERIPGVLRRDLEVSRTIAEWEGKGPVIAFQVEGAEGESVSNMVDTRHKLLKAMGAREEREAYLKLLEAMNSPGELSIGGAPKLREASRGLLSLPAARFYEKERGLYVSSSIFIACFEGVCNASVHRIYVKGERRGVVRVVPRHLWELYKRATAKGQDLPVTVLVGVHPAVEIAAATSPRFGVFELGIAAKILGGLEAYESPLHRNPVPVGAAAVIEGYLTREMEEEGMFVDVIRTYDKVRLQPGLKVEAVYLSDEPTRVILSGGAESSTLMGFSREAAIWEAVSRVVPRVHRVRLTKGSGGWLHAIISISKAHEGDGKNALLAAFAAHPSLKMAIVVDEDIDVDSWDEVEWALATRFQPDEDLLIIRGARGSTLDPSAREGLTSKMGIDATKPLGAGMEYELARPPKRL
ncbi:MAG: UbiD family decarboxylase [Acidilobaceae archaeon]|nr:UbiD family decarboxylase [Acidilobaceae archaeon]